jgi:hypothetical protein
MQGHAGSFRNAELDENPARAKIYHHGLGRVKRLKNSSSGGPVFNNPIVAIGFPRYARDYRKVTSSSEPVSARRRQEFFSSGCARGWTTGQWCQDGYKPAND